MVADATAACCNPTVMLEIVKTGSSLEFKRVATHVGARRADV